MTAPGRRYGLPWRGAEVARAAEAAGVTAFCRGEFVDHEAYSVLAEMVLQTERALVGPGIAYAFARTPYAHAAGIRGAWRHAPGRVFLGLGSGAYKINRDWFGVPADRPVARMADLVGAVRAWLHAENGQRVRYDGEFYRIDAVVGAPVLGRIDAPILLGAFNKLMAAAAGRTADGVIGHGLFTRTWWEDVVRPAVAKGAAGAEREGVPLEHGWVITAIDDDDPERAVMDARRMIAFYLTVKTYDPYVEHHGWTAQTAAIRQAFAARDTDAMARAVTDDMLEAVAVCGTTADGRAALARRGDSLPRDVAYLAPPSFMVSERRGQRYALASLGLLEGAPWFTVDYPIVNVGYDPALVTAAGMTRVARAAEECGYDAISFSEHPAPSRKWLDAGGHESLDQTSALTFCAAVTSRVRLMTYLLVLPYHNPFLAAKALSTVDLLSGGRLTVVAGTGYLRSEFLALNVEMSARNELFDESLEILRGVWSEAPFSYQGKHFTARGVASLPGPAQRGGPPVLIGGNSALARDRAARNQGWSPLMVSPEVARTSRTPGIGTVAELAARIKEVRDAAASLNDAPTSMSTAPLTIQVHTPQAGFMQRPGSAQEHRDHLGQLAEAGVDSFVLRPPGNSVGHTVEALHQYAETFLKG